MKAKSGNEVMNATMTGTFLPHGAGTRNGRGTGADLVAAVAPEAAAGHGAALAPVNVAPTDDLLDLVVATPSSSSSSFSL